MDNKQLSIPGLPVPERKSRTLQLELEVSLLKILVEKGDKEHA